MGGIAGSVVRAQTLMALLSRKTVVRVEPWGSPVLQLLNLQVTVRA